MRVLQLECGHLFDVAALDATLRAQIGEDTSSDGGGGGDGDDRGVGRGDAKGDDGGRAESKLGGAAAPGVGPSAIKHFECLLCNRRISGRTLRYKTAVNWRTADIEAIKVFSSC